MLRISTDAEAGAPVRLKVEGEIAGDWVPLLEAECRRHLDARRPVELDLAGVGFVDRKGVAMLQGLLETGVRVARASPLVNALIGRRMP
ncbi:MAG TPA: STAS domain-containing protein [Gemmatimonadales bacterium]